MVWMGFTFRSMTVSISGPGEPIMLDIAQPLAPARVPTYVTTPMPSLTRDMAAWYVGKAHCDREPSEATPGKAQVAPRALWRRSR